MKRALSVIGITVGVALLIVGGVMAWQVIFAPAKALDTEYETLNASIQNAQSVLTQVRRGDSDQEEQCAQRLSTAVETGLGVLTDKKPQPGAAATSINELDALADQCQELVDEKETTTEANPTQQSRWEEAASALQHAATVAQDAANLNPTNTEVGAAVTTLTADATALLESVDNTSQGWEVEAATAYANQLTDQLEEATALLTHPQWQPR